MECKWNRTEYMKNIFIPYWDLGGVQHMGVLTEDLHKRTTSLALGAPTYLARLYSQHSDITGFGWATESFTVHVPVLTDCSVSISIHFLTQILPHITTESSQAVRHPTVHYVRRQTQEQRGRQLRLSCLLTAQCRSLKCGALLQQYKGLSATSLF